MANLRGIELPTTERTGAGATSVVNQAGSVTIKFCLLPYLQNNLLYVCRQENSMQLQSLFCRLRLSFLGTILDLWGLPLLEGCWNRRFILSWEGGLMISARWGPRRELFQPTLELTQSLARCTSSQVCLFRCILIKQGDVTNHYQKSADSIPMQPTREKDLCRFLPLAPSTLMAVQTGCWSYSRGKSFNLSTAGTSELVKKFWITTTGQIKI